MSFLVCLEDDEGKKYKSVRISAQNLIEPTVEALQSKLEEIFSIEPMHQIILLDDMEIHELRGPLTLIGTGKDYKLVLKHNEIMTWAAFKALLEDIKKQKDNLIRNAFSHLQRLNETKFFLAYPLFGFDKLYFNNYCAHKLDKEKELIETAIHVMQINDDIQLSK